MAGNGNAAADPVNPPAEYDLFRFTVSGGTVMCHIHNPEQWTDERLCHALGFALAHLWADAVVNQGRVPPSAETRAAYLRVVARTAEEVLDRVLAGEMKCLLEEPV